MTWSEELALSVAQQVRACRKAKGMSAQDVSDACAQLGYRLGRSTLANFETGRRRSVDLAELLVLAQVLDVPPVSLIWPDRGFVEVFPNIGVPAYTARNWVRGNTSLPEPTPPEPPAETRESFDGLPWRSFTGTGRSFMGFYLIRDVWMRKSQRTGQWYQHLDVQEVLGAQDGESGFDVQVGAAQVVREMPEANRTLLSAVDKGQYLALFGTTTSDGAQFLLDAADEDRPSRLEHIWGLEGARKIWERRLDRLLREIDKEQDAQKEGSA